jgi:hypothetical protein
MAFVCAASSGAWSTYSPLPLAFGLAVSSFTSGGLTSTAFALNSTGLVSAALSSATRAFECAACHGGGSICSPSAFVFGSNATRSSSRNAAALLKASKRSLSFSATRFRSYGLVDIACQVIQHNLKPCRFELFGPL